MASTYQEGSVIRRKRTRHPDLWEFRWREYMADGTWTYKREKLGTVKEFPTLKALGPKVEEMRARINSTPAGIFFKDVAARYKTEHIAARLRPHAQTSAKGELFHLEVRFNERRIVDVTPGELDAYLNALKNRETGKDLAKATRQHVKARAHHVWRQAMLWGYINPMVNPVSIARITEGARPKSRSSIDLSPAVYGKLLADPELPYLVKTMMQVAYSTGMRVSEILGLKWEDIDTRELIIHVRRSVVGKHVDQTKNVASLADLPLDRDLAEVLRKWKAAEPCWGGWVFGSPITERPYHEMNLQQKHLRPAGERAGISNLGWHSFRHNYSAELEAAGASDRMQQASMRHGDPAMTRKYGQKSPALMQKMREIQDRVVSLRKERA